MNYFISDISIQNFKSIKKLLISDCSRINVFIGEPNVGKSNILEALTLASFPNTNVEDGKLIRYERDTELHYGGNIDNKIEIEIETIDKQFVNLSKEGNEGVTCSYNGGDIFQTYPNAIPEKKANYPFFMAKYHFENDVAQNYNAGNLLAPRGRNLPFVLNRFKELMKEVQALFVKNNQKLILDKSSNSLKVMSLSQSEDYYLYLLPYSSVADTLQRLIFYKAAIISNQKAILLFEEPEACMFPPYISKFTQDIIQSTDNQFFITTHSPVVITDFLENAQEDLSIFVTYFKDEQTMVKKLSQAELHEVAQYGIDLFYNYESFAKV